MITITEVSLAQHRHLYAFLKSSPPDVGLLATDGYDTIYKRFQSIDAFVEVSLNLLQVLSLYGKTSHIEALQRSASEKKEAVKADNYCAIRCAAQNGHLDTLKHLDSHLTDDEKKEAAKAGNYCAIRWAAEHGHLATVQHLESHLTDAEKKELVKADDYWTIRWAAKHGHLAIVQHLESQLTDAEKKEVVKAYNYWTIRWAAEHGHLATVQHLESHLTDAEKKELVKADDYWTIRYAATLGHLAIVQYLEPHLTEAEKKAAVKVEHYWVIRCAAQGHHVPIMHHFLRYTPAFNYIEKHDDEYGLEFTYSFVDDVVNTLKADQAEFKRAQPDGVFDVDEERATQCFYLLRNLIRRGVARGDCLAEQREEDILFLLNIPAVSVLCHQVVTVDDDLPGEENELLRLAINNGNAAAAAILMRLPGVQRLAQANRYYQDQVRGDMDLRSMAQNHESSMVLLSPSEQKLLKTIEDYYQPSLQTKGGIDAVIVEFKAWLQATYEALPATILIPVTGSSGVLEEVALPFEWRALQVVRDGLTQEQYQGALRAYYAHDAHTAYRYLSKPNDWIHPNASFACVNEDNHAERWADFEDYLKMIAVFYLAACDENTPTLSDYTLESRKYLFVKEIALIGRAHNWDRCNEKGQGYDDSEADKPSCPSGVKRRLWQSVLGHPMFQQLKDTVLEQELASVIHNHFTQCITFENIDAVRGAFYRVLSCEEYVANDGSAANTPTRESDLELLSSFNLREERLRGLYECLDKKYGKQLSDCFEFSEQFKAFFGFKVHDKVLHIMQSFQGECIVRPILDKLSAEKAASVGGARFFNATPASNDDASLEDTPPVKLFKGLG